MLKYLIIFILYAVVIQINARIFRHCRTKDINIVRVENITTTYFSQITYNKTGTDIRLKVNLSWVANISNGYKLDGFLIRFSELLGQDNSITPLELCQMGKDLLWVTSSKKTLCLNVSESRDQCLSPSENECLCPVNNCSLLYEGLQPRCRGTNVWITENGYISIQPHIRSLTFNAAFNAHYTFSIKPYYREFVGQLAKLSYVVPPSDNCVETLAKDAGMSAVQAAETCCDVGIPHVIARNVTVGKLVPDFDQDTVNVTVTWLPPISQAGLTGFICFPIAFNHFQSPMRAFAKHTPPMKIALPNPPSNVDTCDRITHYYQTTIYDLIPGESYELQISSVYKTKQEMLGYGCEAGQCLAHKQFSIPAINSCEWEYCDRNAKCIPENTVGNTTMKASCQCESGYEGNGFNSVWSRTSTGCRSVIHCGNKHLYCDQVAICTDRSPPQDGVQCTCPSGHYGDGFLQGGGCKSKAVLGLKIGIPLTFGLTLLIVLIAWKSHVYRFYKKTFRFARFSN